MTRSGRLTPIRNRVSGPAVRRTSANRINDSDR